MMIQNILIFNYELINNFQDIYKKIKQLNNKKKYTFKVFFSYIYNEKNYLLYNDNKFISLFENLTINEFLTSLYECQLKEIYYNNNLNYSWVINMIILKEM